VPRGYIHSFSWWCGSSFCCNLSLLIFGGGGAKKALESWFYSFNHLSFIIIMMYRKMFVYNYFYSFTFFVVGVWLGVMSMLSCLISCARGDTICLRPLQLTISSYLFATWHLFRHVGYFYQQRVDLWPFWPWSGVRVTCDVGYRVPILVFLVSGPLCSRVKPDVRDRQTDVIQKHRLMPPPYGTEA